MLLWVLILTLFGAMVAAFGNNLPERLKALVLSVQGWIGAAFGWFFAGDLPYNLCPSLHIALRTILAETYSRHTRGFWRIASVYDAIASS